MSRKKPAKSEPEVHVHDISKLRGKLKAIGGSMSDDWNNILANQTIQTMWLKNADAEEIRRQRHAAVDALNQIANDAALARVGDGEAIEGEPIAARARGAAFFHCSRLGSILGEAILTFSTRTRARSTPPAEVHGEFALHGVDPLFSIDPLPPEVAPKGQQKVTVTSFL